MGRDCPGDDGGNYKEENSALESIRKEILVVDFSILHIVPKCWRLREKNEVTIHASAWLDTTICVDTRSMYTSNLLDVPVSVR